MTFTKQDADRLGWIWDEEKEHKCFLCHRPTRFIDLCFEGPLCSTECEEWAYNDMSEPKVKQGPQPHWDGCKCPALDHNRTQDSK